MSDQLCGCGQSLAVTHACGYAPSPFAFPISTQPATQPPSPQTAPPTPPTYLKCDCYQGFRSMPGRDGTTQAKCDRCDWWTLPDFDAPLSEAREPAPSKFCHAPVNEGRHLCRFPKGHEGAHHAHINANSSDSKSSSGGSPGEVEGLLKIAKTLVGGDVERALPSEVIASYNAAREWIIVGRGFTEGYGLFEAKADLWRVVTYAAALAAALQLANEYADVLKGLHRSAEKNVTEQYEARLAAESRCRDLSEERERLIKDRDDAWERQSERGDVEHDREFAWEQAHEAQRQLAASEARWLSLQSEIDKLPVLSVVVNDLTKYVGTEVVSRKAVQQALNSCSPTEDKRDA